MRGSDAIVKLLIAHGVKYVFGLPGDTSMNLYDSFAENKNYIKHILTRDERSASYMADAYARVSGEPGVVEVPSGGGALYAAPGVSEANVSNIPLICLSSDISIASEETNALTDTNQEYLFKAITKWNTKVKSAHQIPFLMRKAFRLAIGGTPGAVQISVPEDILSKNIDLDYKELISSKSFNLNQYNFKNEAKLEDINQTVEYFTKCFKPIIIAGGGVHFSEAYDILEIFVEKFCIPVATSIRGKGSIQEFSPYSVGVIGANGGSEEGLLTVKEADLILVLGSKLNNVTTMGKSIINPSARVIQIDIGEESLDSNIRVNLAVMSDIKLFLSKLYKAMSQKEEYFKNRYTEWNLFVQNKIKEKYFKINEENKLITKNINPANIFRVLEKLSDDNTIFVADAGTPTPFLSSHLRLKKAGRKIIIPRGLGSLGYAIPASIGAKLAEPKAKVISLFGDGSFCMAVGELETAKRLNLPILFINFQNDSYGWIKSLQKLYYDERYFSVDFSTIDIQKIAEGFGLKSWTLTNSSELEEGIREAINQNIPVLLNIVIESPTKIIPPVLKWEQDSKIPVHKRAKITY